MVLDKETIICIAYVLYNCKGFKLTDDMLKGLLFHTPKDTIVEFVHIYYQINRHLSEVIAVNKAKMLSAANMKTCSNLTKTTKINPVKLLKHFLEIDMADVKDLLNLFVHIEIDLLEYILSKVT